MSARRMWADTDWRTNPGGMYVNAKRVHTSVPVLVTDATNMPDFKPGDRVRWEGSADSYEVDGLYRDKDGDWCAALHNDTNGGFEIAYVDVLTKLPRETSVLLRVTGPEDQVEHMTEIVLNRDAFSASIIQGVRVERVEEER